MTLTLIGDVHRKFDDYLRIVEKVQYSIQLGDFGYKEEWDRLLENKVDSCRHKILRGNHDYPIEDSPYDLGDYGPSHLGEIYFWFMRGAKSRYPLNERKIRPGINWWPDEEISEEQTQDVVTSYVDCKPEIVITHDCPAEIKQMLTRKKPTDRTSLLLSDLLRLHQPERWYFGHHHRDWVGRYQGTFFSCIDELSTLAINV